MNRIIVLIVLLAQIVMAGTALAVPVNLDFTSAPGVDVTTSSPFSLNGVTISYDDYGSGLDFANVGSSGIIGSMGGVLIFDFNTSATALNIGFSLLDAVSNTPQLSDALTVVFYGKGNFLDSTTAPADFFAYDSNADPTLGFASGILAYSGTVFDHAELYFSSEALYFTVDNVSYEPVPEPGTIVLLAVGLFGLGIWRFKRQSC